MNMVCRTTQMMWSGWWTKWASMACDWLEVWQKVWQGFFLDGWWWLLTSQLGCSKEDWQLRKLHQCLLLGWAPERHRKGDSHLCRFWHWLVQKLVAGYSFLVHVPQSSSVLFFLRHRELPQLLAWLQDRLLPDELLQNRCCMQATKPYKSPKTNQMYEAGPRRVPTLILQDSEDQMKSDGRWREVEAQGTIDRSWWPSRSYHCLLRWAAGGDISADINSIITEAYAAWFAVWEWWSSRDMSHAMNLALLHLFAGFSLPHFCFCWALSAHCFVVAVAMQDRGNCRCSRFAGTSFTSRMLGLSRYERGQVSQVSQVSQVIPEWSPGPGILSEVGNFAGPHRDDQERTHWGSLCRWISWVWQLWGLLMAFADGTVLGVLGIAWRTVTVRLWCVVSSPLILGFVPLSVGALLGLWVILSLWQN